MDTNSYSDNDSVAQEPPTCYYEEGEVSALEQDTSVTDTDQATTEEQYYRGIMSGVRSYMGWTHGIRSYMGWTHIPDNDNQTSRAEDNPFAAHKQQPV